MSARDELAALLFAPEEGRFMQGAHELADLAITTIRAMSPADLLDLLGLPAVDTSWPPLRIEDLDRDALVVECFGPRDVTVICATTGAVYLTQAHVRQLAAYLLAQTVEGGV